VNHYAEVVARPQAWACLKRDPLEKALFRSTQNHVSNFFK
jgi:hypothetical protein